MEAEYEARQPVHEHTFDSGTVEDLLKMSHGPKSGLCSVMCVIWDSGYLLCI